MRIRIVMTVLLVLVLSLPPALGVAEPVIFDSSQGNNYVASIAVSPNDPARVWVASEYFSDPQGELYESRDYAASWELLPLQQYWPVAPHPTRGAYLSATSWRLWAAQGDLICSDDFGRSWSTVLPDPPAGAYRDVLAVSSTVYALYHGDDGSVTLQRSINDGLTWSDTGLVGADSNMRPGMAISADGSVIYVESDRYVYASADAGSSWTQVYTSPYTPTGALDVEGIAIDPTDSSRVYIATEDGVRVSLDEGVTWSALWDPAEDILAVAVSASGRVFAGGGTYGSDGGEGVVYVSDDHGASWDYLRAPDGTLARVNTLVPDSDGFSLYIGTDWGIDREWIGHSKRLAGEDRYKTAIEIARVTFPVDHTASAVVIATGANFPDALAGVPLAHKVDAPLLLSRASGLDAATLAEIERAVAPGGTAYLLGESDVVPASVQAMLEASGFTVERLAGETRYETAVAVAEEFVSPDTAFLAVGTGFADCLSASSPAALEAAPILFTAGDELSPATRAYLENHDIERLFLVGGSDVVSGDVMSAAASYVGSVERLSGPDRYATCRAVVDAFFSDDPFACIGFATGLNFPDALAGAVLCADGAGPLFITRPEQLSAGAYFDTKERPQDVFLFGGEDVLPLQIAYEIETCW